MRVMRPTQGLPKNTTQCPRPGFEPRPHDPDLSSLTMRPPRLHKETTSNTPKLLHNLPVHCGFQDVGVQDVFFPWLQRKENRLRTSLKATLFGLVDNLKNGRFLTYKPMRRVRYENKNVVSL